MKKRSLLAFIVLLVLVACSESRDVISDEKGSLYISSTIEGVEFSRTRAEADVDQFTLILENKSNPEVVITGVFSEFPNGKVEDVPVGNYELTLTSHPDGFVPAFEDPWYKGVRNPVPVSSGATTLVTVECVQANAGIKFVFDPSLEQAGLGDIVPEMTQDGTTLYFKDENREAKAYFNPKQVELRIKHGNEYLKIGGKEVQTLDLGEEQLWETTLKASDITGKMSIRATVKIITEPTHFIEFELGDVDAVDVTEVEIGAYTASFLAKGEDITSMKFGLFATASLDFSLGFGMSLEEFMDRNGDVLDAGYLAQLNTADGLLMSFDGVLPQTPYSLVVMPTRNNILKAQRYNFVSNEGITPDPVQDPNGPVVPGTYSFDIFEEGIGGGYSMLYNNEFTVAKAIQNNTYIIKYLFLCDLELIAEYDKTTRSLVFTGKDILEYDIFNDVSLILGDGELYAGIYISDGEKQVDKLEFTIEDRKLNKASAAIEFHAFDALTGEEAWVEVSPLHNPFTYVSSSLDINWSKVAPMGGRPFGFSSTPSRSASTRAKNNVELRSSVTELK